MEGNATERLMRTITFMVTPERDPSVWRKLELTDEHTLHDVHSAIQDAFLLDRDHAYSFFTNNHAWDMFHSYGGADIMDITAPNDACATQLGSLSLPVNKRLLYLFDYGDELRHEVKVIGHGTVADGAEYPRVVDAHGTPPPQYPVLDEPGPEDDDVDEGTCQGSEDDDAEVGRQPQPELVALIPNVKTCVDAYYRRRRGDSDEASQKNTPDDLAAERDLALALLKHSGASIEVIHTDVDHAIDGSVWGWLSSLPWALSQAGRTSDAVHLALAICDAWRADHLVFELPLLLARDGRRAEAVARTEENLSEFPEDADMLLMAGRAFQHIDSLDRAEECYRQALAWAGSRAKLRSKIVDGLSQIFGATGREPEIQELRCSERRLWDGLEEDRLRSMGLKGPEPVRRETPKTGRNAPCPCGSGKKYKKCCGKVT
jgi:hypothetical protein